MIFIIQHKEGPVFLITLADLKEYLRKKKVVGTQYPATVTVRKNVCLHSIQHLFSQLSVSGYCYSMTVNILQTKAELAAKQNLQKCRGMCSGWCLLVQFVPLF